ncbi:GTPase [Winogradskyella alexanderae]|uniref:GTPase n=1 Tax=Winogradskyella alexanderae TaxID=2877123 RepID=A0ABS7XVB7_9FLAO|nr:GTPase [Winogradskyella alexanderae]MCA0133424.1 GTPase [Winogradskyella alexanderae]
MILFFIYNSNSGPLNALIDVGHKLINPKTYPCSLCKLTYDTFSEKAAWKSFKKRNKIDMRFYHKDEFEIAYPNENFTYPLVLMKNGTEFFTLLSKKDLDKIKDENELIKKLTSLL